MYSFDSFSPTYFFILGTSRSTPCVCVLGTFLCSFSYTYVMRYPHHYQFFVMNTQSFLNLFYKQVRDFLSPYLYDERSFQKLETFTAFLRAQLSQAWLASAPYYASAIHPSRWRQHTDAGDVAALSPCETFPVPIGQRQAVLLNGRRCSRSALPPFALRYLPSQKWLFPDPMPEDWSEMVWLSLRGNLPLFPPQTFPSTLFCIFLLACPLFLALLTHDTSIRRP